MDNDIVADMLRRVLDAVEQEGGLSEMMARTIEDQVRMNWGGARHYIQRTNEERRIARDDKILDLWENGERDVVMLGTRFGLSPRQIRRIVKG